MESLDKLREWSHDVCGGCECDKEIQQIADEIEHEIEDRIGDLMTTGIDGYPEPFNTPDAMHMILGTAADNFETPQDAVLYLQGYTSMLLPVDADGVPIHVGDSLNWEYEEDKLTVCAVAPGRVHHWVVQNGIRSTIDYPPSQCTHYKPRTIEDVLREFAQECAKSSLVYREADIEHYADELRSMGVGE